MKETSSGSKARHRSREEAARLVGEFEQSGMTRKAFCIERGVAVHTLDDYGQRLGAEAVATTPQLLPVEPSPQGMGMMYLDGQDRAITLLVSLK